VIQVVAVVGPTASGKTSIAIRLAEHFKTEIISADSMQFYRGMEIGTAAPTPADQARVKHHCVGFLDPSEDFSAGAFEILARNIVARLNAEGKPAVVVGGSGLYIGALIDSLFPGPGKAPRIRARLHEEAQTLGTPALYTRLELIDSDYAHIIQPGDLRRIVRALEVFEITGRPLSQLHREHRQSIQQLHAIQFAPDYPRNILYDRINQRVEAMIRNGLVEEVKALIDHDNLPHIQRLRSLGYREIANHLQGNATILQAIETMKMNTRRYAKRQLTWFRADPRIQWLPVTHDTSEERIESMAFEILAQETGKG
jgi:tRNA dimethylallyltransferase